MNGIDRRGLLTLMLGAAAAATIGSGPALHVAEAAPLPPGAGPSEDRDDVVQQAQYGPPSRRRGRGRGWDPRRRRGWGFGPRRRRWACWRSRGRRVCGWRSW
jgi:hypothetical protein